MSFSDKAFKFFMYLAFGCLALGIFGSTSLLGVYTSALGLASLIYYYKNPKSLFKVPKSSIPLLILVVIGIITFILNYSETQTPFKMLSKLKYFLAAAMAIKPMQYFFKNIPKKHIQVFIKLFIISIFIACTYGFIGALYNNQIGNHVFEGIGNRSGGLTDIMRFSYGLALIFPIVISYLNDKDHSSFISKTWIILLIILIIFGVVTAQSRGAILGLALAFPICVYFKSRKLAIAATIFSLFIIGSYIYSVETNKLSYKSSRIFQSLESRSNLLRLSQFKTAYYAIKEKPFFGHGMGRFKPQVERLKNQYDLPYKDFIDQHSHNVFFEIAAQLGIVGLLTFLSWFSLWGYNARKNNKLAYYIPFVCIFFIIGQFEQLFLTNNMILTFSFYQLSLLNFQSES